jgi:hypothetical protein
VQLTVRRLIQVRRESVLPELAAIESGSLLDHVLQLLAMIA